MHAVAALIVGCLVSSVFARSFRRREMQKGWLIRMTALGALVIAAGVTQVLALPALGPVGGSVAPTPPEPPRADGGPAWLCRAPTPTIELVAMVGDPAPGLPAGVVYDYLSVPQIDGAGNVLFAAFVDGPGISVANNLADFYGPPGAVSKIVRESEPAFGIPGAVISNIVLENLAENGLIALTLQISGPRRFNAWSPAMRPCPPCSVRLLSTFTSRLLSRSVPFSHSPPLARNHAQSAEFRLKADS